MLHKMGTLAMRRVQLLFNKTSSWFSPIAAKHKIKQRESDLRFYWHVAVSHS